MLADGTIDLGRFGRRVVAGKTVEQIEEEVQQTVDAAGVEKSTVNVRLITPRSAVYYVLGEVNSPGAFPLVGRETVLDGILAGGGLTSRASRCDIILSRPTTPDGCRVVLPICYRHIAQLGDTTTNYQLMPGDRIYVASRTCCEQLAFWNQNDDCDHCRACQSACPDGYSREGAGPIYSTPPNPAAPMRSAPARPTKNPEDVPAGQPQLGRDRSQQRAAVTRRAAVPVRDDTATTPR